MALVYEDYTCVGELVSNFSDSRPRIEERLAQAMATWLAGETKRQCDNMKAEGSLLPVNVGGRYEALVDAYTALGDIRSAVDALCSQLTGMVTAAARGAVDVYVKGVQKCRK